LVGSASASICGSGSGRESCYLLAAGGAGGQPVAIWQWQQWQWHSSSSSLGSGGRPLVGSASASICGSGSSRESCYSLAAGGAGGQGGSQ
jgi:hypothetical protein